jgi:hypothetical protein
MRDRIALREVLLYILWHCLRIAKLLISAEHEFTERNERNGKPGQLDKIRVFGAS